MKMLVYILALLGYYLDAFEEWRFNFGVKIRHKKGVWQGIYAPEDEDK
jgi:hypothetical protein